MVLLPRRIVAVAAASALLLAGCVTTTASTQTWGDPYAGAWSRPGHVETVQETVYRRVGDPVAGAAAGAALGGLFGALLGSHPHHGGWAPSPAGAFFGAATGAAVGAAASQGGEDRVYDVVVRFDDGAVERFAYRGWSPFRPGDPVQLTPGGLAAM